MTPYHEVILGLFSSTPCKSPFLLHVGCCTERSIHSSRLSSFIYEICVSCVSHMNIKGEDFHEVGVN